MTREGDLRELPEHQRKGENSDIAAPFEPEIRINISNEARRDAEGLLSDEELGGEMEGVVNDLKHVLRDFVNRRTLRRSKELKEIDPNLPSSN